MPWKMVQWILKHFCMFNQLTMNFKSNRLMRLSFLLLFEYFESFTWFCGVKWMFICRNIWIKRCEHNRERDIKLFLIPNENLIKRPIMLENENGKRCVLPKCLVLLICIILIVQFSEADQLNKMSLLSDRPGNATIVRYKRYLDFLPKSRMFVSGNLVWITWKITVNND